MTSDELLAAEFVLGLLEGEVGCRCERR